MPEYTSELYNWINSVDNTFSKDISLDSFKSKMSDQAYAKKMYDWVSQNDKTFKNDMSFDAFYAKANSGKKKVSASNGAQKQQPTSLGGTATQRSQSSATSGKGDGIYKLGTNDKATYKKEGGQWYVDWNSNGNFMPLKKGDVQARVKNLEANAKINVDLTGSYMPKRAEELSIENSKPKDIWEKIYNFGGVSEEKQKLSSDYASAMNEKVFTGLKGKEENLYRIQNGNWQRKTPASNGKYSEWSDVTNEQAIKILNTNFKQNVGFEAAKAAQEIEKTKHRYADVTSKLIDHQEKRVVSYLTDRYASRGFTFEETGMGDFMIVRSKLPGVAPLRVSLDNWTSGDDIQQAKNLREYLIENEYTPEKAKELEFAQKISEISASEEAVDPNLRQDSLSESTNFQMKQTIKPMVNTFENILKVKEVEDKYGIKADDLISKLSAKVNIYKSKGSDIAAGEVAKSKVFNITAQKTAELEMSNKVMINAAEELKAKVGEFKSKAADMTEEEASAMAEEISVMQGNLQRMMNDSEIESDSVRDLVDTQAKMKVAVDYSKGKQGTGAGALARTATDALVDSVFVFASTDFRNEIKDGIAGTFTATTQEAKSSDDRSTLNKLFQSIIEMGTIMATSAGAGRLASMLGHDGQYAKKITSTFQWFSLSTNRSYDAISKEVPDMPEEEKQMLSIVIGATVGALEKYGVDSVASSKVAQNYVTKSLPRILAGLPQDASLDMVQKAISADIKKVMIQRGVSSISKMVTEGATEATQTFAEAGIKEAYDALKGKDFFKQDFGTIGMNAVNDFILGAAAGGIVNSITSLPSTAIELRSAKNYGVTKEVINDPELLAILKNDMRVRVANGEITKFEAQQKMHALREVKILSGKVPQGLTVDQEQKAVELIAEKEQLTKEIEGKEPNLVVSKAERINEINEQLKTISTDAVQGQTTAEGSELGLQEVEQGQEEVTIDKPTIAMNAQVELDRVKQADIASEDGATLNLDGTKYDGGGLVVPVASMNTTVEEITPDMIADFVEQNSGKIGDQNAVKVGVYKFPGSNEMSIDFNVVVPESSREQAIEFGRQADQESLFDLGTFENVKTGGTGKNPAQFTDAQFKEIAKALNEGRVPNVFTKVNQEIEQAREAISKIGGPEVIVFNTQEEYQQALADAAGIPLSAIQLEEKENRTDGQQIGDKVFIDASNPNASSTTVFHEAAHWALTKAGVSQEGMASFVDAIRKVAKDKNLVDYLDRFSTQAEYVETGQSQEEFLVELMGRLAADKDGALSTTNYQKVLNAINKLLESIGMKPIFKSTASRQEVVDFVNRMAKGLREGDASIVAKDYKENKSDSGSRKKSIREQLSSIDVNKVRSKDRPGKRVSKGLSVKDVNKQKVVEETDGLSLEYVKTNAPNVFISNANIISKMEIVSGKKKFPEAKTLEQAQEIYDVFIREVADNLNFLMNEFNPEYRDISTLWYDGANVIANEFSNRFGVSPEQAAGVIAAMSPQKDWYQNVRLAELVFMAYKDNPVFTKEMVEFQSEINRRGIYENSNSPAKKLSKAEKAYKNSRTKANKDELIAARDKFRSATESADAVISMLSNYVGKKLSDVPSFIQPYIVRTYHEVNTTKDYNIVAPDGTSIGVAKKKDGENAKVAWGSYAEIGKAVSIMLDGSQTNISVSLGEMHKIRNFYNNIIDPMSKDGDVTMDTHAVAAALLLPVSGSSKQVTQNFGSGTSNSRPFGIKGLYYAYAEAYSLSAKEAGLLPRQVQSITWEAVRGLYTDKFKGNKENVAKIDAIWNNYKSGNITIDEARKQATEAAGGINDPSWVTGSIEDESGESSKQKGNRSGAKRDERGSVGSRSTGTVARKKRISQFAEDKLTDDGNGNYVFHHWSQQRRDKIKPGTGQNIITGRSEASAMSAVGGLAQYYTMADQAEPGTGSVLHTVLVPKEKVYDFNLDPEGWYQKAKYRFDQARPGQAFGANEQLAFVTQIANENGYDMVVAKWRNGTELRAQTTLELTPEAENVNMKPREDEVPEVGDDVIVSGSEAKVTDVVGDFFDYKGDGVSGRINYVKNKRLWRKKRISPTKDAAISQAMENYKLSMSRAGDKSAARKAALADLKKNDWWTNASDVDREAALRELRRKLGLKEVPAAKTKREGNDVTVDEYDALVSVIKREAKAARDKKKQMKEVMQTITEYVREQLKKKKILPRQASAIMGKVNSTNFDSKKSIDALFDYVDNVASDAAYMEKLSKASQLRKALSRRSKNGRNPIAKFAKTFSMLNPKYAKDIDLYLGVARMLNSSLDRSAVDTKTGEVKWKKEYSIEQMADYLEQELKNHAEIELQKLKNRYEKLTGNSSANMSADQIQEALRKTPAPVADVTDEIKERLEELKQSVDDDAPQSVKDAANIDPTIVDNRLALDIIDAIDSYLVNGLPGGIDKIMARYEALKSLSETDMKARKIRIFGSKKIGRVTTEYATNINMMIERQFAGVEKAGKFMKLSGWSGVVNGHAKAVREAAEKSKAYMSRYKGIKNFNSVQNIFERGAIAFLSRTNQSTDEFGVRRKLLLESEKALLKGNDKDIARAKEYNKVFEKLGLYNDDATLDSVMAKAEEYNKDAVKWVIRMWGDVYGDFRDFSLSMRNTMLANDINYSIDKHDKIKGSQSKTDADEEFGSAHAYLKYANISLNKNAAGVLIERTHSGELTDGRYVSLDFDTNNMRGHKLALVDMYTAKSIYQLQEFMNSDKFNEIVPDADDRDLMARAMKQYVNAIKGKSVMDVTSLNEFQKFLNVLASFGAARALVGVSQAISQYSTATITTIVNAGIMNVDFRAPFNTKVNEFINRSGTATANRGYDSMSGLVRADEMAAKVSSSMVSKGSNALLDTIGNINETMLNLTLVKPDVVAARTAWWAYYNKYCKKNKIEVDLDGEVNKDAAEYAQQMVDRNMDVSDAELKGMLFKQTGGFGGILKNLFFPFASFSMNMKQRLYNDLSVLGTAGSNAIRMKSDGMPSNEDISTAARSFGSIFAEMLVYNGIRYYVASTILEAAMALLDLDDEEKKAMRDEIKAQALENVVQKAIEDLISPSPITNGSVLSGVNLLLDAADYGVSQKEIDETVAKVNEKRLNDGKEEMSDAEEELFIEKFIAKNQYQFYISDDRTAGMYGIQYERLAETLGMIRAATTGEYYELGRDKEWHRRILTEDARKKMFLPALLKSTAQLTVREFDQVSNRMYKILKKQSSMTPNQEIKYDELKKAGVKIDKAIMQKIKDGASVETIIDFDSYYANWTEAERLKAIEEEKGQ